MLRKALEAQCRILFLFGSYFALRLVYTKEIYVEVNGYTINILSLIIQTSVYILICKLFILNKKFTF
ncbi:hypothetical protein COM86_28850 [Priestia megaterium]|jgi:hypothetical protein|nr:hypothetical protein COM86_28850 [Priestia megaterium]PEE73690.1 hypothetical protein COM81_27270 [Priestia megaterium]PFI86590.1 hypothetical protein COI84_27650 [Priestia megaterium]PGR05538.1 hypothetical protein COC62_28495 [Priestia megaterium]